MSDDTAAAIDAAREESEDNYRRYRAAMIRAERKRQRGIEQLMIQCASNGGRLKLAEGWYIVQTKGAA